MVWLLVPVRLTGVGLGLVARAESVALAGLVVPMIKQSHPAHPSDPAGRKHSIGPPAVAEMVRFSRKNGKTE
jgi:hypothetical protein